MNQLNTPIMPLPITEVKTNPHFTTKTHIGKGLESIPLEKLCSLEVRELLEEGTPRGSCHNESAIKVAKELIGVESYCQDNGIGYQGTAKESYEQFLVASGIDSDSLTESRWKSAIAANPSPSLSSDKIENCLNAWYRQNGNHYHQDRNYPLRRQVKSKAKALSLLAIKEPVTLAKFEVIPNDFPQPGKPSYLPSESPENATQITYPYSLTQFIDRFDWEDTSKPKGRDKTFKQYCVNEEGNVIWGKGTDPWPCYRESEVITAKGWPLLNEGEKCVDTARCSLGLVSITLQGSNWGEEAIAATLTRIKEAGVPGLILITDNDKAGESKGKKVLTVSAKIDFPVIVTSIVKLWEDAPDAGDLADWVKWGKANGMNTEDFIKRLEAEIHDAVNRRSQEIQPEKSELTKKTLDPEDLKIKVKAFIQEKDQAKREVMLYEFRQLGLGEKSVNRIAAQLTQNSTIPRTTRLNASEFRSRVSGGKKWLIPGLISHVGVTLITGPSGGGKSTFAFDLAGSVICGTSFMGETIKENGTVIFACSDEPTDESQERSLLKGFFHSDNFEFLEQWNLGQMEILEEAIADRLPKLVVVDSFDSIHRRPLAKVI